MATHAIYPAVVLKIKFISSHTNKDIARLPYGSREFHLVGDIAIMIFKSNADLGLSHYVVRSDKPPYSMKSLE